MRGIKMILASWLLLSLVALIPYGVEGKWGSSDPGKVLLRDVHVLILKNGKMTTGSSSPVPQLKCVGGSAQGEFSLDVVQCYNRGWDGMNWWWECKAISVIMDNHNRFGEIEVVCEGCYDHGDNAYRRAHPFSLACICRRNFDYDLLQIFINKSSI